MEVAQLLGSQGPWWHQVCRHMDCLSRRNDGPITIFLASSSWQSEILFSPSLLLGHSGTLKAPWLRSFSMIWHIRRLNGHPGWGPSLWSGASGT